MTLAKVLVLIAIAIGSSIAIAAVLLAVLWRRLKRLAIAEGTGYVDTLRAVPLGLVVALDLLDLALDFLALPLVWAILSRLQLSGLRTVAVVQSAIPFTQPLPLLTLSWVVARLLPRGTRVIETERGPDGSYRPRR